MSSYLYTTLNRINSRPTVSCNTPIEENEPVDLVKIDYLVKIKKINVILENEKKIGNRMIKPKLFFDTRNRKSGKNQSYSLEIYVLIQNSKSLDLVSD